MQVSNNCWCATISYGGDQDKIVRSNQTRCSGLRLWKAHFQIYNRSLMHRITMAVSSLWYWRSIWLPWQQNFGS